MASEEARDELCTLLSRLEPVMLRRTIMGSRLSPETLPDEILLLESVVVLREKLCGREST